MFWIHYGEFCKLLGPTSGCVLHGKIDKPVIMENGSTWFLIDLDCTAQGKSVVLYDLTGRSKVEFRFRVIKYDAYL